jgi:hypothetical protein
MRARRQKSGASCACMELRWTVRSFPIVGHIQPSGTPPLPRTTPFQHAIFRRPWHILMRRLHSCPNVSGAARKFEIERSTLSKHFHGKRGSIAQGNETKQLLTNNQELVLVNHIQMLCDWCLPPTPATVCTWAKEICGHQPKKNWSAGFKARHKDVLDCRYLNTIDLARHKADSAA